MKQKILSIDWLADFKCIGGGCPLTCCSANWNIMLNDSEIERYEQLSSPFREELLSCIDKDNKVMKNKGHYCSMLTEDGWCRLIQECGEEYLSSTCKYFPRGVNIYGDIREQYVEILCPVVAGYLFNTKPIEFNFKEEETTQTFPDTDYQIYDTLSSVRSFLVDLVQSVSGYGAGKIYIILNIVQQIENHISATAINPAKIHQVLQRYSSSELLNTLLINCEELNHQLSQKSLLLKNFLLHFHNEISSALTIFEKTYPGLYESAIDWILNSNELELDFDNFSKYIKEHYAAMIDNYLVYILFIDFINLNKDKNRQKFYFRFFELILIQCIATFMLKQNGKLTLSDYELIIASIDRVISHSNIPEVCYPRLKELDFISPANILMMLIY